jgi:hypothetical protein
MSAFTSAGGGGGGGRGSSIRGGGGGQAAFSSAPKQPRQEREPRQNNNQWQAWNQSDKDKTQQDWKDFWEDPNRGGGRQKAESRGAGWFSFLNSDDMIRNAGGDPSRAQPLYDQYGVYGYEMI